MLKGFACFASLLSFLFANYSVAQEETQEQLLQKYQAMVIIEEANQHCPLLSNLEAEVLRGQIIFANGTFSGKLDRVEKFKKEARIFARRAACNAPEILGLIGLARQQASDTMINHLLLARQIHLLDEQAVQSGVIPGGLLLRFLTNEQWQLVNNLHDEVKGNYLAQATTEDWEKFYDSVEKVAEDKTAQKYMANDLLIKNGAPQSFDTVQARANNSEITSYYYNLKKSVNAFVDGAAAEKNNYPFSRPANDFTNWKAYRPRSEDKLNWVISYVGCGDVSGASDCTLFTGDDGQVGVVVNESITNVSLQFRNPEDDGLKRSNKAVEGPIGSNELNAANFNDNLEAMLTSDGKVNIAGIRREELSNYTSQTGTAPKDGLVVYMFSKDTLPAIEALHKNDVLRLTFKSDDGGEKSSVISVHNYPRAKNWAFSVQ